MYNPNYPRTFVSRNTHEHCNHVTGELTSKPNFVMKYEGAKSFKKNTDTPFLNIPCGHCSECVAVKQQSFVQRVYMETKYNHVFFATLTYDNKHLPTTEVFIPKDCRKTSPREEKALTLFNPDGSPNESAIAEVLERTKQRILAFERDESSISDPIHTSDLWTTDEPEGHIEVIPYADIHHLQLMFKRMRDNNTLGRSFRYIAVTERGKKRARPHAHIMFFVPKRSDDTLPTCIDLEQKLRNMLLQYWSTNVGTRKNPVYERNFTLRERWIGNKLYRNFDCHYVNPVLTTSGVNDVTFYVTKYMFKESKKEEQLRKMLFRYLVTRDEETGEIDYSLFNATWDVVKSRMVCSKGLGLDASFETIERVTTRKRTLPEYAEAYRDQLRAMQDLPENDCVLAKPADYVYVAKRTRILVPNFDIMQELKDHALLEKEKGRFVFVNYNGEHFTLAKYYQDRVLSEYDFVDLYYSTHPEFYPDPYRADKLSKEELDKKAYQYQKRCELIDEHEVIDGRWSEIERGQDIDPYSPYKSYAKMVLGMTKTIKSW